jgi:hypothetical protein
MAKVIAIIRQFPNTRPVVANVIKLKEVVYDHEVDQYLIHLASEYIANMKIQHPDMAFAEWHINILDLHDLN